MIVADSNGLSDPYCIIKVVYLPSTTNLTPTLPSHAAAPT